MLEYRVWNSGSDPTIILTLRFGLNPMEPKACATVWSNPGTVMSGLLPGILLARSAAGYLAQLGGWRTVFWAAAG